jgi:hypothetical protein
VIARQSDIGLVDHPAQLNDLKCSASGDKSVLARQPFEDIFRSQSAQNMLVVRRKSHLVVLTVLAMGVLGITIFSYNVGRCVSYIE